ncbi:MAG: lipid II flippase MurJ, partial [Ferrovum sp.]|nr:lipid II flippase MurJ [Ferrovum sp.]
TMAVAGVPLVSTLFFRGAFRAHDVLMVRDALMAYSLGLTGLIAVKILAPGFYARQNIKTPVKIAILVLGVTQIMNVLFMNLFQHAGLALATGLGACLNATLLYTGLRRRGHYRPRSGWVLFLAKLAMALGVMGLVLWQFQGTQSRWLTGSSLQHAAYLAPLLAAAAADYFAMLCLLGFRLKDFSKSGA